MLDKVDPLKGPITRPVVVRQEEGDEQGATHRGGGRRSEIYGFFDPEHGIRMRAGITTYTPERYNPRHRHSDEAVRYYYRGAECYGRDVMEEGDCVYVPEGVYYGPTRTAEKCAQKRAYLAPFPRSVGISNAGMVGGHASAKRNARKEGRTVRERAVHLAGW